MRSKRVAVFGAVALLSVVAAGSAAIGQTAPSTGPNVARAAPLGPIVDHHQHLLSPAGAALLQKFEGGGALAPSRSRRKLQNCSFVVQRRGTMLLTSRASMQKTRSWSRTAPLLEGQQ